MWIVGRKQKQGVTYYILQNDIGQTVTYEADYLKSAMEQNKIIVNNAKLTPAKRIYMLKDKVPTIDKTKGVGKYPRTKEIQNMSRSQKIDYYWNTLIEQKNIATNITDFTVDELDSILEGSLSLEIGDHGSSGTDIALGRNLYCFSTIGAVLKECQRRGYLTEKECSDYLLGMNDNGRYCNQYSFAEWIMKHKKKFKDEE